MKATQPRLTPDAAALIIRLADACFNLPDSEKDRRMGTAAAVIGVLGHRPADSPEYIATLRTLESLIEQAEDALRRLKRQHASHLLDRPAPGRQTP